MAAIIAVDRIDALCSAHLAGHHRDRRTFLRQVAAVEFVQLEGLVGGFGLNAGLPVRMHLHCRHQRGLGYHALGTSADLLGLTKGWQQRSQSKRNTHISALRTADPYGRTGPGCHSSAAHASRWPD